MQSVYNKIKEVVEESDPGTLFFPEDFAAIGTSDAIRAALVRLCRSGVIMRAAQGIYYHPKVDTKWGSGIIPPTTEEIAEGIAKRDKVRIVPTGAYCLNLRTLLSSLSRVKKNCSATLKTTASLLTFLRWTIQDTQNSLRPGAPR